MIQPVAFIGRASEMKKNCNRLSISDVIRLLGSSNLVSTEDFVPLPCSHPLCFSLAYYLMLNDGGRISVNRLVKADSLMDSLCNRTVFGLDEEEHNHIKDLIYDLWSGPVGTAPDGQSVLNTLRSIMDEMNCGCFNAKKAFSVAEQRIKSIFIHAFQDTGTFDLARVRRCCNAYPQPNGRLIPACVHNVMGGRA
jgi:7,8-dihydro-6-hydroxymethylpterin dimethyltransferase